jgi:hypothetical protein
VPKSQRLISSVTLRLMEGARHRSADFVGYCDRPATRRTSRGQLQKAPT